MTQQSIRMLQLLWYQYRRVTTIMTLELLYNQTISSRTILKTYVSFIQLALFVCHITRNTNLQCLPCQWGNSRTYLSCSQRYPISNWNESHEDFRILSVSIIYRSSAQKKTYRYTWRGLIPKGPRISRTPPQSNQVIIGHASGVSEAIFVPSNISSPLSLFRETECFSLTP